MPETLPETHTTDTATTTDVVFLFPESAGVRIDRVQRIREQLVAGTFDIDARLDSALDRLAEDLDLRLV